MTQNDLDDDDEVILTPARWSWLWLLGFGVNTAGNVGRLVTSAADELAMRIARHDMWRDNQRDFRDQVRRDLEAMPESVSTN